jgi:hypothetical protein
LPGDKVFSGEIARRWISRPDWVLRGIFPWPHVYAVALRSLVQCRLRHPIAILA